MTARRPEGGYTLIAVMAGVTIMLLTMAVGVPFWRHVVRDDREQELIFRGERIALAIERYQKRHANAPPASLEVLVEMKFLRKLYTDPMTESGEWRLIRQGEAIGPIRPPGSEGGPSPTPDPRNRQARASRERASGPRASGERASRSRSSREGGGSGGIVGVASRSEESGLRIVNGRERYDEWLFVVGQVPVVVGKAGQMPGTPPSTLPGGIRGRPAPNQLPGAAGGPRAPNRLPGPNQPRGRQNRRPGER